MKKSELPCRRIPLWNPLAYRSDRTGNSLRFLPSEGEPIKDAGATVVFEHLIPIEKKWNFK